MVSRMAGCMLWMMPSKMRICGRAENRPGQQDAHDMRRSQDFSRRANVGLDALWQRIDVFFQFGKAQGPPNVAIGNIRTFQDDIVLDRALEEAQLRVDHESATAIDGFKIQVAEVDSVIANHSVSWRLQTGQDARQRRFRRCGAGVDPDLLSGRDFKIESFENRRYAGMQTPPDLCR